MPTESISRHLNIRGFYTQEICRSSVAHDYSRSRLTEVGPPLAPLGKMRMDLEDGGPPGGVSLVISSEGEILTEL